MDKQQNETLAKMLEDMRIRRDHQVREWHKRIEPSYALHENVPDD